MPFSRATGKTTTAHPDKHSSRAGTVGWPRSSFAGYEVSPLGRCIIKNADMADVCTNGSPGGLAVVSTPVLVTRFFYVLAVSDIVLNTIQYPYPVMFDLINVILTIRDSQHGKKYYTDI